MAADVSFVNMALMLLNSLINPIGINVQNYSLSKARKPIRHLSHIGGCTGVAASPPSNCVKSERQKPVQLRLIMIRETAHVDIQPQWDIAGSSRNALIRQNFDFKTRCICDDKVQAGRSDLDEDARQD
jgi:hypothetical protein